MNVARNVMLDPRLVPGGGAAEMALAHVSTSTEYICGMDIYSLPRLISCHVNLCTYVCSTTLHITFEFPSRNVVHLEVKILNHTICVYFHSLRAHIYRYYCSKRPKLNTLHLCYRC